MKKFNWKRDWWIDGMSMMCFTHHFCRANALSFPQFRRAFYIGEPSSCALYMNSPRSTSLDVERLIDGCGIDSANSSRLFPSAFLITDTLEQCSGSLRYCPRCIDQGIHLSLHQLEWMVCCPVHLEALQTACTCGARVPYTLTNKSRTSEALCNCDELRFGEFSPFDDHEKAGLEAAFKTIAQLRNAFQYGLNQYRVSVGVPGKEELREQVDLTEAILLTVLSRDDTDPSERGLRTLPIQIPYLKREIQERLEDRFAQFTRWAKAKSDGVPELWSAAMIARVVEEEYFDDKGQDRIELAIEDNGESRGRRGCDGPMIVHLLSIRLLEGLARGHRPVGRSLSPDIRLAFRMYGEPLCQIVWHEEATRVIGTAYWLDLGVKPEGHDVPWIRALAEFLVAKRFNPRLGHSRIAALQEPRVLASFDQIFGGCAEPRGRPAAQQLPLFDWLG